MTALRELEYHLELYTDDRQTKLDIDNLLKALRPNAENEAKVQMGKDDGYTRFYQIAKAGNGWLFRISKGFKQRLLENISFDEALLLDGLDTSDALEFLKEILPTLPFKPYKHQLQGFMNLTSNRNNLSILATGAGKSLIAYLILKYFYSKDIKTVLVVPTIGLTTQMLSDIEDYIDINSKKQELAELYEKLKEFD